ncbi:uncharacterized protein LOC100375992, partial [Saccoglossus kowalevskii]
MPNQLFVKDCMKCVCIGNNEITCSGTSCSTPPVIECEPHEYQCEDGSCAIPCDGGVVDCVDKADELLNMCTTPATTTQPIPTTPRCPVGMVYRQCVDACPLLCHANFETCEYTGLCEPGCQCLEGRAMDINGNCISPLNCNCTYEGELKKPGSSWMNGNCEECRCYDNSVQCDPIICEPLNCPSGFVEAQVGSKCCMECVHVSTTTPEVTPTSHVCQYGGMEWQACAVCQLTCQHLREGITTCENIPVRTDGEGDMCCRCAEDQVLDAESGNCVLRSECECEYQGMTVMPGSPIVVDECYQCYCFDGQVTLNNICEIDCAFGMELVQPDDGCCYCESLTTTALPTTEFMCSCPPDSIPCDDCSACYIDDLWCDDRNDCDDGSDERNCPCEYDGNTYENGENFVAELPCIHCTCTDGRTMCEKQCNLVCEPGYYKKLHDNDDTQCCECVPQICPSFCECYPGCNGDLTQCPFNDDCPSNCICPVDAAKYNGRCAHVPTEEQCMGTTTSPTIMSSITSIYDVCNWRLGMEPGRSILRVQIPDSDIQASSSAPGHPAYAARLNGDNYWMPEDSSSSLNYLQIELLTRSTITSIAMQGDGVSSYVPKFVVDFSFDGMTYEPVTNVFGVAMEFEGSENPYEPNEFRLEKTDWFEAKFIRIKPRLFVGAVAIRMEVIGCPSWCPMECACFRDDELTEVEIMSGVMISCSEAQNCPQDCVCQPPNYVMSDDGKCVFNAPPETTTLPPTTTVRHCRSECDCQYDCDAVGECGVSLEGCDSSCVCDPRADRFPASRCGYHPDEAECISECPDYCLCHKECGATAGEILPGTCADPLEGCADGCQCPLGLLPYGNGMCYNQTVICADNIVRCTITGQPPSPLPTSYDYSSVDDNLPQDSSVGQLDGVAWRPFVNNVGEFIDLVDLPDFAFVTQLVVQGDDNGNYVTKFSVDKYAQSEWTPVIDLSVSSSPVEFDGPSDGNAQVTIDLPGMGPGHIGFEASKLRIRPLEWVGAIGMRVAALGCALPPLPSTTLKSTTPWVSTSTPECTEDGQWTHGPCMTCSCVNGKIDCFPDCHITCQEGEALVEHDGACCECLPISSTTYTTPVTTTMCIPPFEVGEARCCNFMAECAMDAHFSGHTACACPGLSVFNGTHCISPTECLCLHMGSYYLPTATWTSPADPCEDCVCFNNEPICEKRPCSHVPDCPEEERYIPFGECCAVCPEVPTTPSQSTMPTTLPGICNQALGMASRGILDTQISASSYEEGSEPANGRLFNQQSWSPKESQAGQWLQIDFESPMKLTKVVTQGSGNDRSQVVDKYEMMYSIGGDVWETVKQIPQPVFGEELPPIDEWSNKEFDGNFDGDIPVEQDIPDYVPSMVSVRIVPVIWKTKIALRVEFFGCPYEALGTPSVATTTSGTTLPICSGGKEFVECPCHATCTDLADSSFTCDGSCEVATGCDCPVDMVEHNGECISPSECPCYFEYNDVNGESVSIWMELHQSIHSGDCDLCQCLISGILCVPGPCNILCEPGYELVEPVGGCCYCLAIPTTTQYPTTLPACQYPLVYEECSCNKTCDGTECESCEAGCFCPEGLFMEGNRCIQDSHCNCVYEGITYLYGERWNIQNYPCWECTCQENSEVFCDHLCEITCEENEVLIRPGGLQCCYCEPKPTTTPIISTTAPLASTPISTTISLCYNGCFDVDLQICFQVNETWKGLHHCETCECVQPGKERCIEIECSHPDVCPKGYDKVKTVDGCCFECVPDPCPNEFTCSVHPVKECMPSKWVCDGTIDCSNGADEDPEICEQWTTTVKGSTLPPPDCGLYEQSSICEDCRSDVCNSMTECIPNNEVPCCTCGAGLRFDGVRCIHAYLCNCADEQGNIRTPGETWSDPLDICIEYQCVDNHVISYPVPCAPTTTTKVTTTITPSISTVCDKTDCIISLTCDDIRFGAKPPPVDDKVASHCASKECICPENTVEFNGLCYSSPSEQCVCTLLDGAIDMEGNAIDQAVEGDYYWIGDCQLCNCKYNEGLKEYYVECESGCRLQESDCEVGYMLLAPQNGCCQCVPITTTTISTEKVTMPTSSETKTTTEVSTTGIETTYSTKIESTKTMPVSSSRPTASATPQHSTTFPSNATISSTASTILPTTRTVSPTVTPSIPSTTTKRLTTSFPVSSTITKPYTISSKPPTFTRPLTTTAPISSTVITPSQSFTSTPSILLNTSLPMSSTVARPHTTVSSMLTTTSRPLTTTPLMSSSATRPSTTVSSRPTRPSTIASSIPSKTTIPFTTHLPISSTIPRHSTTIPSIPSTTSRPVSPISLSQSTITGLHTTMSSPSSTVLPSTPATKICYEYEDMQIIAEKIFPDAVEASSEADGREKEKSSPREEEPWTSKIYNGAWLEYSFEEQTRITSVATTGYVNLDGDEEYVEKYTIEVSKDDQPERNWIRLPNRPEITIFHEPVPYEDLGIPQVEEVFFGNEDAKSVVENTLPNNLEPVFAIRISPMRNMYSTQPSLNIQYYGCKASTSTTSMVSTTPTTTTAGGTTTTTMFSSPISSTLSTVYTTPVVCSEGMANERHIPVEVTASSSDPEYPATGLMDEVERAWRPMAGDDSPFIEFGFSEPVNVFSIKISGVKSPVDNIPDMVTLFHVLYTTEDDVTYVAKKPESNTTPRVIASFDDFLEYQVDEMFSRVKVVHATSTVLGSNLPLITRIRIIPVEWDRVPIMTASFWSCIEMVKTTTTTVKTSTPLTTAFPSTSTETTTVETTRQSPISTTKSTSTKSETTTRPISTTEFYWDTFSPTYTTVIETTSEVTETEEHTTTYEATTNVSSTEEGTTTQKSTSTEVTTPSTTKTHTEIETTSVPVTASQSMSSSTATITSELVTTGESTFETITYESTSALMLNTTSESSTSLPISTTSLSSTTAKKSSISTSFSTVSSIETTVTPFVSTTTETSTRVTTSTDHCSREYGMATEEVVLSSAEASSWEIERHPSNLLNSPPGPWMPSKHDTVQWLKLTLLDATRVSSIGTLGFVEEDGVEEFVRAYTVEVSSDGGDSYCRLHAPRQGDPAYIPRNCEPQPLDSLLDEGFNVEQMFFGNTDSTNEKMNDLKIDKIDVLVITLTGEDNSYKNKPTIVVKLYTCEVVTTIETTTNEITTTSPATTTSITTEIVPPTTRHTTITTTEKITSGGTSTVTHETTSEPAKTSLPPSSTQVTTLSSTSQ